MKTFKCLMEYMGNVCNANCNFITVLINNQIRVKCIFIYNYVSKTYISQSILLFFKRNTAHA